MTEYGHYCYKVTCYETVRLIAQKAGLVNDNYSVAFQSRLSNKWLNPFIDDVIKRTCKKRDKICFDHCSGICYRLPGNHGRNR